jgi:hypothetical protein
MALKKRKAVQIPYNKKNEQQKSIFDKKDLKKKQITS